MSKRSSGVASGEIPLFSAATAGQSSGTQGSANKGKMPENDVPTPDPGLPTSHETHGHHKIIRHRFLSSAEWASIAHGIGGVRDGESHIPCHPSH